MTIPKHINRVHTDPRTTPPTNCHTAKLHLALVDHDERTATYRCDICPHEHLDALP